MPEPDRAPVLRVVSAVLLYLAGLAVFFGVLSQPIAGIAWLVVGLLVAASVPRLAASEAEGLLRDARTATGSPRLQRLVDGLAGDLGIPAPAVWVYEGGPLNAFVAITRNGTVVCFSSGLADAYPLTELEAVVAHCLVRLKVGLTSPGWSRRIPGWTKRIAACSPARCDVATVALTRYPPALASAIRKAGPRDGRDQGLWFVPRAAGSCGPSERAAALEDL